MACQRIRAGPPGRAAGDPRPRSRPLLRPGRKPLAGKHALVTSGPTHEPIDPVRYIANRCSGRQGHAIAEALAGLGARVTLVSGPVRCPTRPASGARGRNAPRQMLAACRGGVAGRRRGVRRRGRRLARRERGAGGRSRRRQAATPAAGAGAESGHPGDHRAAAPGGRLSWSASRRKRRRDGQRARRSSRARAATGSSPTTFLPEPGSWAAGRMPCISSPRRESRVGRFFPKRRSRATRGPDRRDTCLRSGRKRAQFSRMTERAEGPPVELRILDPRLREWGMPAYQSEMARRD